MTSPAFDTLLSRISDHSARVGIIGLGYVGLPLAVTAAKRGLPVTGFDIDPGKIDRLVRGESYIEAVESADLAALRDQGRVAWTCDFAALAAMDVIVICVPTPLTAHRDPDLSYITTTAAEIARHLSPATLVVLESTTYPGTTADVMTPILAQSGHVPGRDIFIGFSPEREDPGNAKFRTATIPKIVAGDGPEAGRLVEAFYGIVVDRVVPVSSTQTAEAVKITENIFRAVNIALVNELKMIFDAMGIDVWEVIDGAATKPFGFMPFYPGPGLGGHCIPIDPFYLTWKAREYGLNTRFIELSGEINAAMPHHVVDGLVRALSDVSGRAVRGAKVLVAGLAYKKNINDIRESPALEILTLLRGLGADVAYHDPHCPEIPPTREYGALQGMRSVPLSGAFHAVVVVTDHDAVDWQAVAGLAPVIVDTRNVYRGASAAGDSRIVAC